MPSSRPVGGMRMSVITTSGSQRSMTANNSGRSDAVPTSSKSWLAATSRETPSRRRTLSSASATLMVAIAPDRSVAAGRPAPRPAGRLLLAAQDLPGAQPGRAPAWPGGQQVGGQQGQRSDQQQRPQRERRVIGQRCYVGGGAPEDPAERDAQRDPEGQSDDGEQARLRGYHQPALPPGEAKRPQYRQFVAATAD